MDTLLSIVEMFKVLNGDTMAGKPKAILRKTKPGDYVAIATGANEYCYARCYRDRAIGVLPVRSRGLVPLEKVSGSEPAFFARLWVYDDDPTQAYIVGHRPFESEEASFPPAQYHPPDDFDQDYRIRGFKNAATYIKRTSNPEDVKGMEEYIKLQPGDLGPYLAKKKVEWPWLEGSQAG
ncbi:helix-hairpin-helix domain-containing protein [Verrucomicrobium spinosum]|uniref:helix-hairpin-helix domain-containing protein n=2 Tax=Verrucomicrobium spinosum TaxID=2736 RepID=UPI000492E417|nr:helix-hairpin-helix domain-containing protein [Verrucomicrobium spinosum]